MTLMPCGMFSGGAANGPGQFPLQPNQQHRVNEALLGNVSNTQTQTSVKAFGIPRIHKA